MYEFMLFSATVLFWLLVQVGIPALSFIKYHETVNDYLRRQLGFNFGRDVVVEYNIFTGIAKSKYTPTSDIVDVDGFTDFKVKVNFWSSILTIEKTRAGVKHRHQLHIEQLYQDRRVKSQSY